MNFIIVIFIYCHYYNMYVHFDLIQYFDFQFEKKCVCVCVCVCLSVCLCTSSLTNKIYVK